MLSGINRSKMENKNLEITMVLVLLMLLSIFPLIIFKEGSKFNDYSTSGIISGMAVNETTDIEVDYSGLELSVEVPGKYQDVNPGETLQFQITIKNLEKSGRHDIQLDYYIKKNEVVLANRREIKAIETQASILSSIEVPEGLLPGRYDIVVEINEEKRALDTFYVRSSELTQIKIYIVILTIAILVVGVLISFELRKLGKRKKLG